MFLLSVAFWCLIAVATAVYQEAACSNAGGKCMSTAQSCSGTFLTGYCPTQPTNIKCCMSKTGKVTAKKVLDLAIKEVGYKEGANNYNKYSPQVPGLEYSQNQYWCDTFVNWCFYKAGQQLPTGVKSAGVAESRDAWKRAGRFSKFPAIGAQVIYGRSGNAHTGLVYKYDKTYIYTIEGNKGDGVNYGKAKIVCDKSTRDSECVYGYGYPDYSQPIVSADPSKGGISVASV